MNKDAYMTTCPVCRKKFIPAPQNVYKLGNKDVCSWKCLCEGRRNGVSEPSGRAGTTRYFDIATKVKAVFGVVRDRKKGVAVAREVGCSAGTVTQWVRAYQDGEFDTYIKEAGL